MVITHFKEEEEKYMNGKIKVDLLGRTELVLNTIWFFQITANMKSTVVTNFRVEELKKGKWYP